MMRRAVTEVLERRGSDGWLVGGSLRDRELGRFSPDLDIVVADDPVSVARSLAARLGAPWFALSERHGAYRVLGKEGYVDVAPVRGGAIAADLGLRDFTVNAMARPLGAEAQPRQAQGAARFEGGLQERRPGRP
jgi:tRNA nucleotidyltransferase/poly(A) polymerase